MNTPNKLTVLRIVLAPLFLVVLMWDFAYHDFVALAIFILASLTDMWDGKIARARNLITNFGKFLDPLADKMLTTAAFLAFMSFDMCYGMLWVNMIILTREFLVTSVRLLAASGGGKVIAANFWGKLKTVMQMVAIITTILFNGLLGFEAIAAIGWLRIGMVALSNVSIWLSVLFTVISGVIYAVQNKEFIGFEK